MTPTINDTSDATKAIQVATTYVVPQYPTPYTSTESCSISPCFLMCCWSKKAGDYVNSLRAAEDNVLLFVTFWRQTNQWRNTSVYISASLFRTLDVANVNRYCLIVKRCSDRWMYVTRWRTSMTCEMKRNRAGMLWTNTMFIEESGSRNPSNLPCRCR